MLVGSAMVTNRSAANGLTELLCCDLVFYYEFVPWPKDRFVRYSVFTKFDADIKISFRKEIDIVLMDIR